MSSINAFAARALAVVHAAPWHAYSDCGVDVALTPCEQHAPWRLDDAAVARALQTVGLTLQCWLSTTDSSTHVAAVAFDDAQRHGARVAEFYARYFTLFEEAAPAGQQHSCNPAPATVGHKRRRRRHDNDDGGVREDATPSSRAADELTLHAGLDATGALCRLTLVEAIDEPAHALCVVFSAPHGVAPLNLLAKAARHVRTHGCTAGLQGSGRGPVFRLVARATPDDSGQGHSTQVVEDVDAPLSRHDVFVVKAHGLAAAVAAGGGTEAGTGAGGTSGARQPRTVEAQALQALEAEAQRLWHAHGGSSPRQCVGVVDARLAAARVIAVTRV